MRHGTSKEGFLLVGITALLLLFIDPTSGATFQQKRTLLGWGHARNQRPATWSRRQSSPSSRLQTSGLWDHSHDDMGHQPTSSSSSAEFAMDPDSSEAQQILDHLGLSESQRLQLKNLATLVVDWNERINLVSRKDCTVNVVFGRHILPCLAPLAMDEPVILSSFDDYSDNGCQRVVDVGTGGGFPGLPLAIAYPNVQFVLVDSVGKKLGAVRDMAQQLGLKNVQTHHGRAEDIGREFDKFDVCVGRSVAAIPKYCAWIQNLLKDGDGRLLYIIGGDIEQDLLDKTVFDTDIDRLLDCSGASDKRILVFPQEGVVAIAKDGGEPIRRNQSSKQKPRKGNKKNKSKGAWAKRDSSLPKQRGYEQFNRFDSNSST